MTVVFFTDRNLGKLFPKILAVDGFIVKRHDEHFRQDTPDEDWLKVVGKRGWVVITHDRRIRYKPNELDAVIRNHVAMFTVVGKARFEILARNFVRTRAKIELFLASNDPPFIARVT